MKKKNKEIRFYEEHECLNLLRMLESKDLSDAELAIDLLGNFDTFIPDAYFRIMRKGIEKFYLNVSKLKYSQKIEKQILKSKISFVKNIQLNKELRNRAWKTLHVNLGI